jgi:hypothetical protein
MEISCGMWRLPNVRHHATDTVCLSTVLYRHRSCHHLSGSGLSPGPTSGSQQTEVSAPEKPRACNCPGRRAAGVRGQQQHGEEGADDAGGIGQRPRPPQRPHLRQNWIEKVVGAAVLQGATAGGGRKRSWSARNRDDQGPDNSNRYRPSDRRASGSNSSGGAPGSTTAATATAGGPVAVGCQPAAAWSRRQGTAGVAMSTTAVATLLVEDHISMVAAAAPEATPELAAPPDEAVTVTKQPPRRSNY